MFRIRSDGREWLPTKKLVTESRSPYFFLNFPHSTGPLRTS
jgi:hypothetical protein